MDSHLLTFMILYEVDVMYEKDFSIRLAQLRTQKVVSARDMSLSLGQNVNYINNIETGKALPSMTAFFFICEYLRISPMEFFNFSAKNPWNIKELGEKLESLSPRQLEIILALTDELDTHNRAKGNK